VVRAAVISTVFNPVPTTAGKSKAMAMKSTGEANDDASVISVDALLRLRVDAHCPSFSFLWLIGRDHSATPSALHCTRRSCGA
jgi:hypothetical protein